MISIILAIVLLAIASFIDYKKQIVPDWLSLSGVAMGMTLSWLIPSIHDAATPFLGLISAIGDGIFVVIAMCWYANFTERHLGKDTLGGGDIKIMGALATIVNFKTTFCVILISPLIGLINFAIKRLQQEIYSMPYCPSIFIALLFSAVFSNQIIGLIR
jgi:prepilin signal peptidase PulO-like enzyme (type II secretory pathway)